MLAKRIIGNIHILVFFIIGILMAYKSYIKLDILQIFVHLSAEERKFKKKKKIEKKKF